MEKGGTAVARRGIHEKEKGLNSESWGEGKINPTRRNFLEAWDDVKQYCNKESSGEGGN